MNDIEKIIKSRREEFDDVEPGDGHFDRFSRKLSLKKKRNYMMFRIAAIVIAGLFISVATIIYTAMDNSENIVTDLSPEVQETIYYYSSLNYEMEKEIMDIQLEDKKEKEQIREDLRKYENNYYQLMKDLSKFPNDQRIINALIEYHRSKAQMLEHILMQIKQQVTI